MSEPAAHGTVARARAVQKARTQAKRDESPWNRCLDCPPQCDPNAVHPDMCGRCRQAWNDHQAKWYAANRKKIAANRAKRKAVT